MAEGPKGTISTVNWLRLDRVAFRLAYAWLGDEPPATLLRNPSAHQTIWVAITADFQNMLESGEVELRCITPKGFTILALEDALHEFTSFDFRSSRVRVRGNPEFDFEVKVFAKSLERFLSEGQSSRHGFISDKEREEACVDWLRKTLETAKQGDREAIVNEAVEEFKVSRNFVVKTRSRLIKELGLDHLRKPGRKKKSSK